MVTVTLRNGHLLQVSNNYSLIEKFIQDNTGQAIVLTDMDDSNIQYLVRKEAIEYVINDIRQ